MKLKIYGSRGSMAYFDRAHTEYGGNSSCSVLDVDGHIIVLDCGTGLLKFYDDFKERFPSGFKFDILLSHLHYDHIIGFSCFPPVFSPDSDIRLFTRSRGELPLISQVFGAFRPPYWPISIADMISVKAVEITDEEPFSLSGKITVTPFFTELHDKTTAFRIDADKSVVYLMDYETAANKDKHGRLIELCKNADLIIFDASYLPEDYLPRQGWGHSTFEDGIALAEASGCKKMIFSHISQDYTDEKLNTVRDRLDASRYSIAFDGMETEV